MVIALGDAHWSSTMITTSYTRLVVDCHREELSNRFHVRTNGFFSIRKRSETPESYRVPPVAFAKPLPIGREALDLKSSEVAGTA